MQRNAIRSGAETTGSSKAAWEAWAALGVCLFLLLDGSKEMDKLG